MTSIDVAGTRLPGRSRVPDGKTLLELRSVNKCFGSVQALADVSLEVPAGQITGLVGDNGAGKSTLIKLIAGIDTYDSGEVLWKGEPAHIASPRDATDLGIATVFQDLALCDNLDIVQNLYLGRELLSHRLRDEAVMETGARRALEDLRIATISSVRQRVGSLSGGQRQAIAVARAAMFTADLVILDEPTAALGVAQTEEVLELITHLAKLGAGVIVISHNLVDIFAVSDRIAVLYLGRLVAIGPAREFDRQNVVQYMTTGSGVRVANNAPVPVAGPLTAPPSEADVPEASTIAVPDGTTTSAPLLVGHETRPAESAPLRIGGLGIAAKVNDGPN